MGEQIYLEPLKSAPGRSVFHYYKYSQKLFDSAKKPATDAIKTVSKRAVQKTVKATGDSIGNKIADKIANATKFSKKFHSAELHSKDSQNHETNDEIEVPKERYKSAEKNNKLLMN